jgi:hypothetical protein
MTTKNMERNGDTIQCITSSIINKSLRSTYQTYSYRRETTECNIVGDLTRNTYRGSHMNVRRLGVMGMSYTQ